MTKTAIKQGEKIELEDEHYGKKPTQEDLLKHYANRDPRRFIQFDCFCNVEPGDPIIVPDNDGDSEFILETYELMSGEPTVRILILPGTTKKDAIRVLRKTAARIVSEEIELQVNSVQVNMPCGICGNRCNDNDLDFFTKDNGNQVCGQCALIYAPDLVVQQKQIESQADHAARGSPEDKQLGVYWAYLHDWVEKQKEMKLP